MKIAFVGDSFCQNAGIDSPVFPGTWIRNNSEPSNPADNDWPFVVACKLKAEVVQKGRGGTHFYQSVIDFLPKMLDTDVVIFCVSEPYRIVNTHDLPMNSTWVKQMVGKTGDHWKYRQNTADETGIPLNKLIMLADTADLYYKHLFNQSACEFFQIGLVSFVDQLMKQHNKKVIWFPCFQQSFELPVEYWGPDNPDDDEYTNPYQKVYPKQYIPISGPSASIPLHELSTVEFSGKYSDEELDYILSNDPRRNHFNVKHNHIMADLILDRILADNFKPDIIKMENYFSHMDLSSVTWVRDDKIN